MTTLMDELARLAETLSAETRPDDAALVALAMERLEDLERLEAAPVANPCTYGEVSACAYGSEIQAYSNVALLQFLSDADLRQAVARGYVRIVKVTEFRKLREQLAAAGGA